MNKRQILKCPEHNVEMKIVKIVYGLVPTGLFEKEIENGEIILGGCIEGEFGEYGFVCPIDKEWYVIVSGELVKFLEL